MIYSSFYTVFKYINFSLKILKLLCSNSQSNFKSLNLEILMVSHKSGHMEYEVKRHKIFENYVGKTQFFFLNLVTW